MTGLTWDDVFLRHDTGPGHPERPERLVAIISALESTGMMSRLTRLPFQAATIDDAALIHDVEYLDSARRTCAQGLHDRLDADTPVCRESFDIALRATGACLATVDAVMAGRVSNAFCAHRPPGHHAEREYAMGFCIINHVAVCAEHLIRRHGLRRVAIVDFDVHHGNGTQHAFETRDDVFFVSIHQDPTRFYPGTGHARERGRAAGEGFTLNLPMRPGVGDDAYGAAFSESIIPALEKFAPQFLLISAGFDAADGDPLASIRLTADGFAMMTRQLGALADRCCAGRVVSVLEGGYNLDNLRACVPAHVGELLRAAGR